MVRELYINKINEVALNVTQSKIDSIRKKTIIKSGCRVYDNGYIGVAGTLGEATEETWKAAEKNLENKVPYEFEPCGENKRVRDLRINSITDEEFLQRAEMFLEEVRKEFPNFSLGNKIKVIEVEEAISNDLGLEYKNLDRIFQLELTVKEKTSVAVFDTAFMRQDRDFNVDMLLSEIRNNLKAYNNLIDIPRGEKIPIITNFYSVGGKIIEALNGKELMEGTSIFSKKLGEKKFCDDFTVVVDRSEENLCFPFFDAEGNILENDKFALIENGIIKNGYTDKKTASKYNIPNTAAAYASYDEVPSLDCIRINDSRLSVESGNKTLKEILGDKEAIFIVFMQGGECTNEGDFASPVQMAYLMKDSEIVGRLPEFNVSGNIYEMFGQDYLGQSSDKPYFGDHGMVINIKVN